MAAFRFPRIKPLLTVGFALCAFLAGSAVSAGDVGIRGGYEQCVSRCEQRYQACIANGTLPPAVCESNRLGCLAVCAP